MSTARLGRIAVAGHIAVRGRRRNGSITKHNTAVTLLGVLGSCKWETPGAASIEAKLCGHDRRIELDLGISQRAAV